MLVYTGVLAWVRPACLLDAHMRQLPDRDAVDSIGCLTHRSRVVKVGKVSDRVGLIRCGGWAQADGYSQEAFFVSAPALGDTSLVKVWQ